MHPHEIPTLSADGSTPPKKRGRRPSQADWTKVTVVLFDRQIAFLDRLGADMRATSGAAVSRAHIIRALIDALSESDVDLGPARSEADLRSILAKRFSRVGNS